MTDTAIKGATDPFKITGNWADQSKQLKSKFSQLTDADLKFEAGQESELLSRVESRLCKNREEVKAIIRNVQPHNKANPEVCIFNFCGKEILCSVLESDEKLNLSGIDYGIYFATVDGKYFSKLIIR